MPSPMDESLAADQMLMMQHGPQAGQIDSPDAPSGKDPMAIEYSGMLATYFARCLQPTLTTPINRVAFSVSRARYSPTSYLTH